MEFLIRNARLDDIAQIMRVEGSWEEAARAPKKKLVARIEKFAKGYFLAYADNKEEKVVATITSMPMAFNPNDVSQFDNWDSVTNYGYLPENINIAKSNALYIVSGVIDEEFRGYDIFSPMVLKVVELAKEMSLNYVLAGAVIPGFKRYKEKYPEASAYEYAEKRRKQSLIDPLLHMYEKIGFKVPDSRHIIPEYYPDDASMNYAALLVNDLGGS